MYKFKINAKHKLKSLVNDYVFDFQCMLAYTIIKVR